MKENKFFRGLMRMILIICGTGILSAGCFIPVSADEVYTLQNFSAQLRYGQKTGQAQEVTGIVTDSAGAEIPGAFSFKEPDLPADEVGPAVRTVIFTPDGNPSSRTEFSVTLDVKRAVPAVQWPSVTLKQDGIYWGDILSEAAVIKTGGTAVFTMENDPVQVIPVAGSFAWVSPGQQLETGKRSYTMAFVPEDLLHFERAVCEVELTAQPYPVSIRLDADDSRIKTGEQTELSVTVENTGSFRQLKGEITFYVNGEPLPDRQIFSKEGKALTARAAFTPESKGRYSIYAIFSPEDANTLEARSNEVKVEADQALTEITTKELPAAKAGAAYRADIHTDASGNYPVSFRIKEGSLPDGLSLDPDTGEITGKPVRPGEDIFVVEAKEGKATAAAKYTFRTKPADALAFGIVCEDISYGEKVQVQVKAARNAGLKYSCYFSGRNGTVYDETSNSPSEPGDYQVKAVIEEPAEYAGQAVFTDFTIKKTAPVLRVSADPESITGGGEVTLTIQVSNPYTTVLTDNLPDKITVGFDRDTGTKGGLKGKEGQYTLVFDAANEDGKVRCTVRSQETDYYKPAETSVTVTTAKKKDTGASDDKKKEEDKKKDKDKNKDKDKKKEEEPVVKTKEEVEAEFWQDIIFRIYRAQEDGSTVTINAKGHSRMPETVLEALRTHEKVTLAIVWEGDMIVIPAGKAPAAEKKTESRTLAALSKSYPLTKPSAPASAPQQQPKPPAPSETAKASAGTKAEGVKKNDSSQNGGAAQPSKQTDGSPGGAVNTKPEEESTAAQETESQEESESVTATAENDEPDSSEQFSETDGSSPEEKADKKPDFVLLAALVCAVAGVAAVTAAIIVFIRKGRKVY